MEESLAITLKPKVEPLDFESDSSNELKQEVLDLDDTQNMKFLNDIPPVAEEVTDLMQQIIVKTEPEVDVKDELKSSILLRSSSLVSDTVPEAIQFVDPAEVVDTCTPSVKLEDIDPLSDIKAEPDRCSVGAQHSQTAQEIADKRDIMRHQRLPQIDTVRNVQTADEIEQITHATSDNQQCSNSHVQRQQRYYERHRDEIKKRKRDKGLKKNISEPLALTAAECSRNYRERKRDEINKRRRESRNRQKSLHQIHNLSNVQTTDEIEQITHVTSHNELSSYANIQREQRYYERHKDKIYKGKMDNMLKKNISKPIPATVAERSRKYRERKRQEINKRRRESRKRQQNLRQRNSECNMNNIDPIAQIVEATSNDQQSLKF